MEARLAASRRHVSLSAPAQRHARHARQFPVQYRAARGRLRLAAAPAQFRSIPHPARRHDEFRAPSGSGSLSREEVYAGTEELKKFGTFEGGIFRRHDDVEGRRNTDGYQAIWEHMNGQRMEYPKPRYRDPIILDSANYEWLPVDGMPGVSEKPLGSFTERQCGASIVKLARGATYRAGERSVYLVLSGSGIAHDAPYRQYTALHVDDGEEADIVARDETQIVRLLLPDLSGLQAQRPVQVEAAE